MFGSSRIGAAADLSTSRKACVTLLLGLICGSGAAAEVRGVVKLGAGRSGPVTVALLPLEAQTVRKSAPREHVLRLHEEHFEPGYVIARPGDRLRIVNDDDVQHILVAPYGPQPVDRVLGRAHKPHSETSLELRRTGTLNLFCSIHHHSYARVDIVDTAVTQTLGPNGAFEFHDVPPGRWRLRVAARDGDPVYRELTAFTAPPPVLLTLPALAAPTPADHRVQDRAIAALFPRSARQP